ncbi:hemerythrin domain-containing protein [Nocardia takedensis]|uniref:hemerythrin domain-containing protein n=1 Tax=Nocardia takedensis TaxID=259390 RepID=UPI0002F3939F|nr:hemerythrin domain-containing protein [Nocardia takedensis]
MTESATRAAARPDVTMMRIAHRAMIHDAARFAALTAQVAAGAPCPPARAAAIAEYLNLLCDSIHHHHTVEDEHMWPILLAAAGLAIVVDELEDDHVQLDALLHTLRERANALGAPHADPASVAAALTETLDALAALLREHIAEEERVVFPVVDRYVRVTDWARVEKAAKKGGKLSFEAPRIARHADDVERARLLAEAGPVIRALLGLMTRRFDKREARIAG